MKNQEISKSITDFIEHELSIETSLSDILIRCHNLIAHSVPLDEWDKNTQCDLYVLWNLIELIQPIEKAINQGEVK